jgi:hypothetical protein
VDFFFGTGEVGAADRVMGIGVSTEERFNWGIEAVQEWSWVQ